MKNFHPSFNQMIIAIIIGFTFSGYSQNSLQNLVGARASSLDGAMQEKGYDFVKSDKSRAGIYSYYWKNSNKKCVTVQIVDGHVKAVTNTLPFDCGKNGSNSANNQHHNNNNNNNNYYNKNFTGDPKIGDLKGWSAQKAYQEIRNRGYRFEKDYRNNGKLVKVWYNPKYKKCKKTAEKNGNIDLVDNSQQCGK